MPQARDAVRFEANERVDVPDVRQVQRGARSETRSAMRALLFGSATGRVLGGFQCTAQGPPSALVTVTRGTAIVGHADPDTGVVEYGTALGHEGDASINVDFTGKGAGAYGIWVRFETEPGSAGTRIFWNAATDLEEPRSIASRYVVGWSAEISALSPGTEWFQVCSVAWGGATVVTGNITHVRSLFFEGAETGSFPHVWGDGGNDRNVDRGLYGVDDLYTWVHAMRRQIEEIVGDSQKWYENFTRISATKFQIEGLAATHNWDADTFFFAPPTGNASWMLRANDAGLGFLIGSGGADIAVSVSTGSELLFSSTGGGDITWTIDDGADIAFNLEAGAGRFIVSSDVFSVSNTGAVEAVSYGYTADLRLIKSIDLIPLLYPIFDGGLDPANNLHDVSSQLANSTAIGIAADLEPRIVVSMDAPNWFVQFPIDQFLIEGATLHSVAITWWAPVTNTTDVDVLLKSVLRTGAGTAYSTVATVTHNCTGNSTRQVTEFVFDEDVTRANLYDLRIQENATGTTADMQILGVELTFDVPNVETGLGAL